MIFRQTNCFWTLSVQNSRFHWLIGQESTMDRFIPKMTDIRKSRTRNPIVLLRIATKLCEVCAINDVINMGWMVCMNNVQKFFWLWVWQEVWDLAHGLVTKDYYNFGTSNVNEGAGVFQKNSTVMIRSWVFEFEEYSLDDISDVRHLHFFEFQVKLKFDPKCRDVKETTPLNGS